MDNHELTNLKVDVGVLKAQMTQVTLLCEKMDKIIEKLMDNQDRMASEIYTEMKTERLDINGEMKELHDRITTVDKNLCDKIELTERRIMEQLKSMREELSAHNKKEESDMKKLLEWKWMIAGGIVVLAWLLSNINISKLLSLAM